MPYRKTLISLLALGALASCATPAADPCAGWRPVTLLDPSVDYLAANDPQALREIVTHFEFGRARECW
jgi:hypothetical protein